MSVVVTRADRERAARYIHGDEAPAVVRMWLSVEGDDAFHSLPGLASLAREFAAVRAEGREEQQRETFRRIGDAAGPAREVVGWRLKDHAGWYLHEDGITRRSPATFATRERARRVGPKTGGFTLYRVTRRRKGAR